MCKCRDRRAYVTSLLEDSKVQRQSKGQSVMCKSEIGWEPAFSLHGIWVEKKKGHFFFDSCKKFLK